MRMSLRLKVNLVVGGVVALLVAAMIWLQVLAVRQSVNEEIEAANRVTVQMLNRLGLISAMAEPGALLRYLHQLGRVRANDISLVSPEGAELYRSPPSTYKQGREAPRWFASLVTPQVGRQVINLPIGRLVVVAEPSRAVLDGWDGLVALAGAGTAALLAVNALLFWITGRVVRPFSQIVHGLQRLEAGDFAVRLPPLPGSEAHAIGIAFNRMTAVLQENLAMRQQAFEAERRLTDSRDLAQQIDAHVEAERREIAKALHDELGQSVTAIRSLAMSMVRQDGLDGRSTAEAARFICDEAGRLYDQMHGMIPRLSPMALETLGLAEALGELVERMRASHPGVEIVLEQQEGLAAVPTSTALAVFRVAQEGLTNALRHSGASRIVLRVQQRGGLLAVEVQDDGSGLRQDWRAPGHFGLRWLQERVQSLGGELAVLAADPRGTLLRAALPPSASTGSVA